MMMIILFPPCCYPTDHTGPSMKVVVVDFSVVESEDSDGFLTLTLNVVFLCDCDLEVVVDSKAWTFVLRCDSTGLVFLLKSDDFLSDDGLNVVVRLIVNVDVAGVLTVEDVEADDGKWTSDGFSLVDVDVDVVVVEVPNLMKPLKPF